MDFHRNPEISENVRRKKTTFIYKAKDLGLLGRNLSFFVEKFLDRFLDEYERFIRGLDTPVTPGVGFEPTNPYGQGISRTYFIF